MSNCDLHEKPFDFDQWLALAKSQPEDFEAKRLALIEQTIHSAPADMQQRLRGLQWRIDMERRRAKNPTGACVHIYRMMWNRVYGEDGLLQALDSLMHINSDSAQQTLDNHNKRANDSAAVLQFKTN